MRRFIHIDDVVSAIVKSIKFKNNCLADIQGPEKITLGYLIFLLSKILKKDIKVVENNKKKPSIRNVVISKKIDKLEWRPRIRIKDGLLNIVK
jgi:nucleoside-diphosphate-sugar epimerase